MCSYCKKHNETEVPDPYYGGQQGFEKVKTDCFIAKFWYFIILELVHCDLIIFFWNGLKSWHLKETTYLNLWLRMKLYVKNPFYLELDHEVADIEFLACPVLILLKIVIYCCLKLRMESIFCSRKFYIPALDWSQALYKNYILNSHFNSSANCTSQVYHSHIVILPPALSVHPTFYFSPSHWILLE